MDCGGYCGGYCGVAVSMIVVRLKKSVAGYLKCKVDIWNTSVMPVLNMTFLINVRPPYF